MTYMMRTAAAFLFPGLLFACSSEGADDSIAENALSACPPRPACDGPLPSLPDGDFKHFGSQLTIHAGGPAHRVRDQLLREGEAQWLHGRFAYGLLDKGLEHESVEIYVQRGCGGSFELLGTSETTDDGEHSTVEGVADNGGRVYFEIPAAKQLGIGRHRFLMSVKGDRSFAEGLVDVVGPDAKFFVSDVDGTLTTSENAEVPAFIKGELPEANAHAAEVLQGLADKGYIPIYLSARRAQIEGRTLAFLRERGFPRGVIRVSEGKLGLSGADAVAYKLAELQHFASKGSIAWGFGNRSSDTDAYDEIGISPLAHRVFLQQSDAHGGRTIDGYGDLVAEVSSLPALSCK